MREIKFRGLRVDGQGWVYGYYVVITTNEHRIYWQLDEDTPNTYHIVIPESVGQFTGLKDCKGVDIYEGDIVDNKFKWVISFKDDSYIGVSSIGGGKETHLLHLIQARNIALVPIEIIGNIHQK